MAFPSRHYGSFGDEKVVRTAQGGHPLGQLMELPDGALYRYTQAGEALGAGNLCQTPLKVADHDMDLAVQTAAAVGDTTLALTLGSTAATLDQYLGGYVNINGDPGGGHRYRIQGHAAVNSGGTITLRLDEPIAEALTTASSQCGLFVNPWNGTLLYNISTADGVPQGFAATELANNEFGWLQTRGWGSVLVIGSAAIGKVGTPAVATTAGGVQPHVAAGDDGMAVCVFQDPISVTTDYGWAFITLE